MTESPQHPSSWTPGLPPSESSPYVPDYAADAAYWDGRAAAAETPSERAEFLARADAAILAPDGDGAASRDFANHLQLLNDGQRKLGVMGRHTPQAAFLRAQLAAERLGTPASRAAVGRSAGQLPRPAPRARTSR